MTDNILEKSSNVMNNNVKWLLYSDLRIKSGNDKGALYGWQDLITKSFPFIYSEITGYAICCFSWIASEFEIPDALQAAKEASGWIIKNMHSNLVFARPPASVEHRNELSNVYYSFDIGMIVIGLLSLYKITKDTSVLKVAKQMTLELIKRFFDGEKLIPRLDEFFNPIKPVKEIGAIKWSTISGAYHCKLSLGLIELSRLSNDKEYARISDSLCDYAKKVQKSDGRFITNPGSDIVYLHPHLYACEGLIFSGLKQSNVSHYSAGLKGLKWAMKQISPENGGLYRNTEKGSVEQSDCTAQLLRLLILCQPALEKSIKKSELVNIIDRLHSRLLEFYIPIGESQGAIKYQRLLDTACSWCTMFSVQALYLWKMKNSPPVWIDYFV